MTPEDTSRMAEKTDRQAQPRPWENVDWTALKDRAGTLGVHAAINHVQAQVDAARAADAALLRERDAQIAELTKAVQGNALAVVKANDAASQQIASLAAERDKYRNGFDSSQAQVDTLLQGYAALRAERDAAQQEIAEQQRDYAILSKMMARETEMLRDEEQENTTLRETLQAAWCELIQHDDQPWVKTLAGQVRVVGLFAFPRPSLRRHLPDVQAGETGCVGEGEVLRVHHPRRGAERSRSCGAVSEWVEGATLWRRQPG